MSFRGGRGGGRGGLSGRPSLFGTDIKPDFTPAERYPKQILPLQSPPTEKEIRISHQFLQFQQSVRDSAFFVVERKKGLIEYEDGINDGIQRYSDKFLKRRKVGKTVGDHPYIPEFFPHDLHTSMGFKSENDKLKHKKLDLARYRESLEAAEAFDPTDLGVGNDEDDENRGLNGEDHDGDENAEEHDEDDDFEEDEDGDYNAEQYFDGGDDDYGDDGGDDEAAY
ncbi:DNA-directed RNA polymerase III, subunit Rpc31 [Lipomyces oligophaga]|uniref:DNA-directed RNA polymerase III, subunit Rpc31 n=1 Tax=Lipomyces oligophaga TaxID=45792 RepID=UPI0034CF7293